MRRLPLLLALLGLLLLSGCFKIDADLTVNDDETVDGTMIVAVDQEFLEAMEEMGASSEDEDLITNPEDLPEGSEVEDYEEGGYVGQKVTFEGVTLEEMMASMDEEGETSDEWSLTHEGDEYVFTGGFDLTAEEGEEMMTGMMQDADLSVSITFPGDVTDSNGEVDGNTVTWEPEVGEKNEMRATASDEAGFPVALVVSVVIGLALVGGLVAFLLLRRRGASTPAPGATDTTAAPVAPTAAPAAPPAAPAEPAPPVAEPGQPEPPAQPGTSEDLGPRT